MKYKILIFLLVFPLLSCMSTQEQIAPTPSPRPRPLTEYDLGIWHAEIEEVMDDYISSLLLDMGESINFNVEILPATSLQDDLIFFHYQTMPQDTDFGIVYWWIFFTIESISNRYQLDPQAVIMSEYESEPFGGFYAENDNLLGFCEIPWSAITEYSNHQYNDVEAAKSFTNQWDCTFK